MFSPMSIEPQLCADDKMSCWAKLSMAHRISTKCWMIEKLVERKYLKTGKQQFVSAFVNGGEIVEKSRISAVSFLFLTSTTHYIPWLCAFHWKLTVENQYKHKHSSHSFGWISAMINFYLILLEFCLGRFLFVCVCVYLCQAADFLESAWNEKLHISKTNDDHDIMMKKVQVENDGSRLI